MDPRYMRIGFISILAFTFAHSISCKSRETNSGSEKYNSFPGEMLKDPNPTRAPFGEEGQELQLTANTTPCVSQISTFGTTSDRAWRESMSRAVLQRICGKDPSVAKIWRSKEAYNPASWIAGINLTAVTQNVPRGTAITSRHVIYTKHYGFHGQVGQTLSFLTLDNRVISRKIIEVKYLSSTFDPDVAVVRLDSDLPGSITPMKILDPNAATYAAQYSPLLRIDQENKALIVQASPFGPQGITIDPKYNPPGSAYQLYYENMISGDSSSPSILLMNTANGIMPILFGLVTYSGPGQGPRMSVLAPQIQSAIQSFGDSHKIITAPPPAAPIAVPSCSITASRIGNTGGCSLTVTGSADPINGNPSITPVGPSSWTKSGNVWTGNAACATSSSTVFNATLTGQGGTGRPCETGVIAPVVTLPSCTMTAKRKDQTDTCELTITQIAGKNAKSATISPSAPTNLVQSGTTWTGSTYCAKANITRFAAALESDDGKGQECFSNEVPKTTTAPDCSLSFSRIGTSANCTYTLTRTSLAGTISSFSILGSSVTWDGSSPASNNVACSQTSDTLLTATVYGNDGSTTCSATAPKLTPPSCALTASRQATTNSCSLSLTGSGIIDTSKPLLVSPLATGSWNTNNWTGTGGCPTTSTTTFTATVEGPGGSKSNCQSSAVPPLAQTPTRGCSATAKRASTRGYCNLSISITGEMIGAPRVSPYAPSKWSRSGNVWSAVTSCPTKRATIYSISVSGPGGNNWGCGSNKIPAISN
jgi:hypothetical protein